VACHQTVGLWKATLVCWVNYQTGSLLLAVDRSSSDSHVMCYVLPVLRMTSCFDIMERMDQNQRRRWAQLRASPADRPQSEQIWCSQVGIMGGRPHGLRQCGNGGTPPRTSHATPPLPSNRQYLSFGDCLEDKREDNCSVLCCVRQLCTMICTHA